jgi:hypothetical protein
MIVKSGSQYQVQSESGKPLGKYRSRAEAELRLRQIEYFKHKKGGGHGN